MRIIRFQERIAQCILVLMLAFVLGAPRAAGAAQLKGVATIGSIKGDVQVQRGGAGSWAAAKDGGLLHPGDRIKTGSESSCVLKWAQGNVLKLTAFTNVSIDTLAKNPAAGSEQSSVSMTNGKAYAHAKKLAGPQSSFEIKTPTAIAGVRGTKLGVGVDADETTSVECLEGVVVVKGAAGGEVVLNQKEKTTVKKNEPPAAPSAMQASEEAAFSELEEAAGMTLDIMQPVGNLTTDITPVTIKGRTDPGNTVTVNGNAVTADENGVFTASVDLEEGTNQVKIDAANKKGNVTTRTRVIKYRPGSAEDGLQLMLTSPSEGIAVRDSSITVSGMASPGAQVTVSGNIVDASPGAGAFTTTVSLFEGDNVITVTAKLDDKTVTLTRTVTLDTTPPLLIISQPAAGFIAGDGACMTYEGLVHCTIAGQTEPGAALTVNGTRFTVENDGSFLHTIMLSPETTTITIAAADSLGNRTSQILSRTIAPNTVEQLTITVSPSSITGDNRTAATITVTTANFLGDPVDATVTLTATTGGTLAASSVSTVNGTASTTITGSLVASSTAVTISAAAGSQTASATLTVNPDIPPEH